MLRFILTRLSLVIPTFIGMTLLAFFLIRLVPGDPIETMAGERGIDAARHAALLKEYGLDRPVLVQYGIYIGRVLHGDLGKSMITQEPVLREFVALFPATMELALGAIVFALVLGIPAGIIAAVRRNSVFDHGVMGVSLTGYSMPIFWWGLLLILLFSVQLGWTPVSGRISRPVLHRAGDRVPDDRRAAVRREGRVPVRGVAPHPAGHRARHAAARDHRADDALRDARGAGRGLHPHGARQGPVGAARRRAARAAQRAHPGRDGHRPAGGRAVHRRDPHRDDLLVARRGQVADRGDQPPRLPGAAGRRAPAGPHRDGGEPAGRRHVRHHQPHGSGGRRWRPRSPSRN